MRQITDEHEQIGRGFKSSDEGEVPAEPPSEEVKQLAKTYTSDQLYQLAQGYLVKTVGEMAKAGKHFSAIRQREDRGFVKFFKGKSLGYKHALHFIHCFEIVDRHPKFAALKSSRAVRQLLSLTKPNQDEIAESLADVPLEEFDHVARGEIFKLHAETTKRKPQAGGRGSADPLDLLERWVKEIDKRKRKIWNLTTATKDGQPAPLSYVPDLDPRLVKARATLSFKNDEIDWRLNFNKGDVPFPQYDPWDISSDDKAKPGYLDLNPEIEAAIYQKTLDRTVRVSLFDKSKK